MKDKIKSIILDQRFLFVVSFILIGVFVAYFYLVTQSWTKLPFSTCTPFESPEQYAGVFVPMELNGLQLTYSPDDGFNSCRMNMGTLIGPFISLFSGVIIFGLALFHNKVE